VTRPDPPLVIAHRGASADAPENTVEAYRLAAEQGADWVELDVRRTADDHLAVLHEATLDDGRTLVDCARADLPDRVPTLAEALDACTGMGVNIEIKNRPDDPDYDATDSVAAAAVALLAARDGRDEVLLSSFTAHTVGWIRAHAPHVDTAWLVHSATPEAIAATVAAGHRALHPWDHGTTEEGVRSARRSGLDVNVWTVDDPPRMRALAEMGVTGIVTNVPAVARRLLEG
jgi:glycerophosphoryl diester phosphodiesterase